MQGVIWKDAVQAPGFNSRLFHTGPFAKKQTASQGGLSVIIGLARGKARYGGEGETAHLSRRVNAIGWWPWEVSSDISDARESRLGAKRVDNPASGPGQDRARAVKRSCAFLGGGKSSAQERQGLASLPSCQAL